LHGISDLQGVWQLHLSAAAGALNFPPSYVANLDETTAHWIKLVAYADGRFSIFNPRTGLWRNYPARPQSCPGPSRPSLFGTRSEKGRLMADRLNAGASSHDRQ